MQFFLLDTVKLIKLSTYTRKIYKQLTIYFIRSRIEGYYPYFTFLTVCHPGSNSLDSSESDSDEYSGRHIAHLSYGLSTRTNKTRLQGVITKSRSMWEFDNYPSEHTSFVQITQLGGCGHDTGEELSFSRYAGYSLDYLS